MDLPIDPFWIASQLQLTLGQLIAIPFGTLAVLWLWSRLSAPTLPGNYVRRSPAMVMVRFVGGFGLGAVTLVGIGLFGVTLVAELQKL
jgi:hypothetical protein